MSEAGTETFIDEEFRKKAFEEIDEVFEEIGEEIIRKISEEMDKAFIDEETRKVFEEIEEEIRLKWDPIIRERKAKLLEAYREWSRFNYEEYLNDSAPPTRTPTPSGMTTCVANDAQIRYTTSFVSDFV